MPAPAKTSSTVKPPCTDYEFDVFFPERESSCVDQPTPGEQAALDICAGCPAAARLECLNGALAYPINSQWGVIGGTTAVQRQTILRGRRQEALAGLAR
jgi:hypothetical protein